jgi:hypothetical protein
VVLKIQFPMRAFREEHCDSPANSLGAGDAKFSAISIQGPDLFFGKVHDSSHAISFHDDIRGSRSR